MEKKSFSIQTKLLIMCIFLVLLTAISISVTYYVLTKQDKQRESQQRILITFEIIRDDLAERFEDYRSKFEDFLQKNETIYYLSANISEREMKAGVRSHLESQLAELAYITSTDRVVMYGTQQSFKISADTLQKLRSAGLPNDMATAIKALENQEFPEQRRLLNAIEKLVGEEQTTQYKDIIEKQTKVEQRILMAAYERQELKETGEPQEISATYAGEIPTNTSVNLFHQGQQLGIRVMTPIAQEEHRVGVLIGDIFLTQSIIEHYVLLGKTEVNLFAGNQFSIGTIPEQTQIEPEILEQLVSCEDLANQDIGIEVNLARFNKQDYYQGRCALRNEQDTIGAITVSLSQELEKQAARKMLMAVLTISGISLGVAFVLSVLLSRGTIHAIQNIVGVIGAVAEGDLRQTTAVATHDEIGLVAANLNQMTHRLRTISGQVQDASHTVNHTADAILRQMDDLIQHMEQQSTSVDNTTISVEKIKEFIDVVAQNTSELLSASAQNLSSIQETRASIEEVAGSTSDLTKNLQRISSSVDQVNHAVKDISENTGKLADVAQKTEQEIQHIDQSLKDVSTNAGRSQELADETREAALSGQSAVDASIRGMNELKTVVANTAEIIQEASSWGEQVSAILDIVDEITEQTTLLSLNASIISAQAGEHGRGFAVVADEIKELATRTKDSTKEIGSLVRALQAKTAEGVKNTAEGIKKADQGVQLADAVKEALQKILERATRTSDRAADTAKVIQQTVQSGHIISASMKTVTEMVSQIRTAIQEEEQNVREVLGAVENIGQMAQQVNYANIEQKKTAQQIEESMEHVTEQFSKISTRTEELKNYSDQIVAAMHTIDSTTEKILQNTTDLSGNTIKNLLKESEVLQKIVDVFKVS